MCGVRLKLVEIRAHVKDQRNRRTSILYLDLFAVISHHICYFRPHVQYARIKKPNSKHCLLQLEKNITLPMKIVGCKEVAVLGRSVREMSNLPFFFFYLPGSASLARSLWSSRLSS